MAQQGTGTKARRLKFTADLLSTARLAALPVMWAAAIAHRPIWLAVLLVGAGISDVLDGNLARRSGLADARGSRLDSLADNIILPSALVWVVLLRPAALSANLGISCACVAVYAASLGTGLLRFRRLGDLHLWSSTVAGVLLYLLVVDILATPEFSEALFVLAAAAFWLSSTESLLAQLVASAPPTGVGSVLRLARASFR